MRSKDTERETDAGEKDRLEGRGVIVGGKGRGGSGGERGRGGKENVAMVMVCVCVCVCVRVGPGCATRFESQRSEALRLQNGVKTR